jgi:hypothetical protein
LNHRLQNLKSGAQSLKPKVFHLAEPTHVPAGSICGAECPHTLPLPCPTIMCHYLRARKRNVLC